MPFNLIAMRTPIKIGLSTLLAIVASTCICESVYSQDWRTPGAQRCAVVDCSGGNSGSRGNNGNSAFVQRIDQYEGIINQARAQANEGNWAEAIRIERVAISSVEDDWFFRWTASIDLDWARNNIKRWEGRIANDQAKAAKANGDYVLALKFFKQALELFPDPGSEYRQFVENFELFVEAHNLNEQGRSALKSGDNVKAARLFAQAQKKYPDPAYAENLGLVNKQMEMQQGLSRLINTIKQTQTTPTATASGLDFMPAGSATPENSHNAPKSGLDFIPAGNVAMGSTGSGTFGIKSNPSNPDLGTSGPTQAVTVRSELEHLSSSVKSAQDANAANNIEEKKNLADCGFSNAACRTPDPITIPKSIVQTPAATELAAHVPEGAKDDVQINNSLAWFNKLEMHKAETNLVLADIQKKIDGGDRDTSLNNKKATLVNALNQNTADQAKVKDQIKERLVDRGLKWNE